MQYRIIAAGIIFGAGAWPNELPFIPGQPQAGFTGIHGALGPGNGIIHLFGIRNDLEWDVQAGANGCRRRIIQDILINV